MTKRHRASYKSVETRFMKDREALFSAMNNLDRRSFVKLSLAAMGAAVASGVGVNPHSFQPVKVANAKVPGEGFTIAYISDSHLYEKKINDRFVRALLRAVDDINNLIPQPDFVLYGGDLAQLGQKAELDLGAEILKEVKAPLKMMVGEHDWYLDMGERWREHFGAPTYSFNHKGVHFVVLMSVVEEDFWTPKGMSPMQRMMTVAGLDNGKQRPFSVGQEQLKWLQKDLESVSKKTPVIVFSHSPLYKLYKQWNFWTDDAEQVQAALKKFNHVTVIHGHTHQLLTNRIGNIHFHGLLSTAWPWPYAPEGLPPLTVQMNRPDPFNPADGCGDGRMFIHPDGLVDKIYQMWNRNPITVSRAFLASNGKKDMPKAPNALSY